jgi:hypothetical protein
MQSLSVEWFDRLGNIQSTLGNIQATLGNIQSTADAASRLRGGREEVGPYAH